MNYVVFTRPNTSFVVLGNYIILHVTKIAPLRTLAT